MGGRFSGAAEHVFRTAAPAGYIPELQLWAAVLQQSAAAARSRSPHNAERDSARRFLMGGPGSPLWSILGVVGCDPGECAAYFQPRLRAIWAAVDARGLHVASPEEVEARRLIAAKSLATRREREAAEPPVERVRVPRDLHPHPVPNFAKIVKPKLALKSQLPRPSLVELLMRRLSA